MTQIIIKTIQENITIPVEEGMNFAFHRTPFTMEIEISKQKSYLADLYKVYNDILTRTQNTSVSDVIVFINDNPVFQFKKLNTINYNYRQDVEVIGISVE